MASAAAILAGRPSPAKRPSKQPPRFAQYLPKVLTGWKGSRSKIRPVEAAEWLHRTGDFMRKTLLTVALVLASGSAMASSIEIIGQNRTGNSSVVSVTCAACPPAVVETKSADAAPTLAPGTQEISIREVNGKKQIQRTESWMGGSPVTFVSSNALWLPQEPSIPSTADNASPGTDAVQTSAVSPSDPIPNSAHSNPRFENVPLRPSLK